MNKPLDLEQFEGHTPEAEWYEWRSKNGDESIYEAYMAGYREGTFAPLSECKRQREQIKVLKAALSVILGAHDSKNNGAYMGEAVLCHHYAEMARAALAKVAE